MDGMQILWAVFPVVPSLLSAFIILSIKKSDKNEEKRSQSRKTENILILKNLDAIGSLSEQTTKCLKGEKLNGELDKALEYRKQMKHEMENYLMDTAADTNCR